MEDDLPAAKALIEKQSEEDEDAVVNRYVRSLLPEVANGINVCLGGAFYTRKLCTMKQSRNSARQ